MLDRVTLTGADDSTDTVKLLALTERFPFVEWGILISSSKEGSPRFPSQKWLRELSDYETLPICLHLCGRIVREICGGNWSSLLSLGPIIARAKRLQLNFHAYTHLLTPDFFTAAQQVQSEWGWQLIFQVDGVTTRSRRTLTTTGSMPCRCMTCLEAQGSSPKSGRGP